MTAKIIQCAVTVLLIAAIALALTRGNSMANWSETFQGPAGSPPDPSSWTSVINGAGGGNQELEYYTAESNSLSGSGLVIRGARNSGQYPAWYGPSQFTSGKLWTLGKVNFRYGHIQVTAALPSAGKPGAWPAIWMLGSDYPSVGWPDCGEIDIMENFGADGTAQVTSSVHTVSTNLTGTYVFPAGQSATGMHAYAIDWRPASIAFSVDGNVFFTVTRAEVPDWPFSEPFFMILNLALGGAAGGAIPATAPLPYTMDVQSVKAFNGEVQQMVTTSP